MSALQLFTAAGSVFHGLPDNVIDRVLARAQRRAYASGETLITEGEHPRRMALVVDGFADVFIAGRGAQQQRINRVGPGSTLGEMSLLTGEPASATVRAAVDSRPWPDACAVHTLAASYPRVYQNIGANLASGSRARDRRSVGRGGGTLTRLELRHAPPELALALAASMAWHTRRPTLLLRITQDAAHQERLTGPGAHLLVTPPSGRFAPEQLGHTLDDLRRRYEHVLVECASPIRAPRVVLPDLMPSGPRARQIHPSSCSADSPNRPLLRELAVTRAGSSRCPACATPMRRRLPTARCRRRRRLARASAGLPVTSPTSRSVWRWVVAASRATRISASCARWSAAGCVSITWREPASAAW